MTLLPCRLLAALALLAGLAAAALPGSARAAHSYDSCTGFIDSLPATITTQGTWCLRKHLSTAMTSGNAIDVAANNVTVDCNDFRMGGLAAGLASQTRGIHAEDRQNITIRNCQVRGFFMGITLSGAGHLVEDNRLDNNLYVGISVLGDNNRIRRNAVYDTGGSRGLANTWGIEGRADIIDNTVSGLFADRPNGRLFGISSSGAGSQVQGNKVSGFDMVAVQGGLVDIPYGLVLNGSGIRASNNQVFIGNPNSSGIGIRLLYSPSYCLDNTVSGFATNIEANCIGSGNLTPP